MGDNIFSSREQMLQNSALQAYMNSFSKQEEATMEAKEKADAYNKILEGVTEPIGGLMVGKPVEKIVSKAGRKLLMKAGGEKWLKKQFLKKLSSASNGDLSAFGKDLPTNVESSISDVLKDNVPDRISQAFGRLSKKSQNAINDAREKMGKSRIGDREEPEPVEPEVTAQPVEEPEPIAGEPVDGVPARVNSLPQHLQVSDENPALKDLAGDREGFASWVEDNIPELHNGGAEVVESVRGRILRNPMIEDDLPASMFKNQYNQVQSTTETDDSPTATDANQTEQPASEDNGDANDSLGANQEQTDLPSTEPQTGASLDASEASGAGDDVLEGLQGASDAIDAIAGAEGGLNIFADIAAGIIGLGTLIGGAVGGKKPEPTQTTLLTSGMQYGI